MKTVAAFGTVSIFFDDLNKGFVRTTDCRVVAFEDIIQETAEGLGFTHLEVVGLLVDMIRREALNIQTVKQSS